VADFIMPNDRHPDEMHPYGKLFDSEKFCEIVLINADANIIKTHCGTHDYRNFKELALFPILSHTHPDYCPKCHVVYEALLVANSQ
jgi:hypothetical protein